MSLQFELTMPDQYHEPPLSNGACLGNELPSFLATESGICSAIVTKGSKIAGIGSSIPPVVTGMIRKRFGKTFLKRGYEGDKDRLIGMIASRNRLGRFIFSAIRLEPDGKAVKMRLTPFLFAFFRDWAGKDSSFGQIYKTSVSEDDIRLLEIRLLIEKL